MMSHSKATVRRGPWVVIISAITVVGCGVPAVGNAPTGTTIRDVVAAPEVAPPIPSDATPDPSPFGKVDALPADVRTFKARRDECDHYRGEASPDPGRTRELERQLALTCIGTDAALAALRQRYAGNAAVTKALDDYEDTIE